MKKNLVINTLIAITLMGIIGIMFFNYMDNFCHILITFTLLFVLAIKMKKIENILKKSIIPL